MIISPKAPLKQSISRISLSSHTTFVVSAAKAVTLIHPSSITSARINDNVFFIVIYLFLCVLIRCKIYQIKVGIAIYLTKKSVFRAILPPEIKNFLGSGWGFFAFYGL